MIDREMKMFLWFLAFMVVVIMPIIVWSVGKFNAKIEWCNENGGTMVKTSEGWRCVKVDMIK